MKYKLIALDLDGTLKNSNNEIMPKTKKALIDAQEKGMKIVLASGRPTPGLRHEAKELMLDQFGGYLLSFNGARVVDYQTKETVYEKTLSKQEAIDVYHLSKEHQLAAMTYDEDIILTEDIDDQYVEIEAFINDIQKQRVESFKESVKDSIYKILLTGEPDYVATVVKDFQKSFEDLSIYRSAPYFIEVMANNIDKAQSLDALLKSLNIDKEEMIAFGDGYNDLSMIEYAGMGVAMANAVDEVKERANLVTLSNDDEGIAHALESLLEGDS